MSRRHKQTNNERITKILYNQVSLVIAIGAALFAIISFITSPQKDLEKQILLLEAKVSENRALAEQLANIKDNDLHQIVSNQGEIKQQIQELRDIVIELRTIVRR